MKILVADDDRDLVDLIRYGFHREGYTVVTSFDGESALRVFQAENPDLIVLDLNLPGRDGRQVLREIKADPGLRAIPVIILSTSQAEEDIRQCYELQANCYISKPVGLEPYIQVIRAIESFWLHTVKLPGR